MSTPDNIEVATLNRMVEMIKNITTGLDPSVLSTWYSILEAEAKSLCPNPNLRDSISVVQNPELPMKFEFKSSKRAIPFVVEAIERNLNSMPFATRLYFEKFEQIMESELNAFLRKQNFQA
jgi:hypothetical protein